MNTKSLLMQLFIIVLSSAFSGLVYNYFFGAKLPLIRSEISKIEMWKGSNNGKLSHSQIGIHERALSLDEAYKLYEKRAAIFMDGRIKRNYVWAHIKGAMSVYYKLAKTNPKLKDLNKDQLIVTYCSNPLCPISYYLAAELNQLGFTNVFVFPGGLEEWMQEKYDLEGVTL